uniref:Putative ovule protein n=1 Tax=Solanum chacoense TaxID=4108 RepID=A0A0V0INA7_SOLCH
MLKFQNLEIIFRPLKLIMNLYATICEICQTSKKLKSSPKNSFGTSRTQTKYATSLKMTFRTQ